ncbi:hypothetical protein M5K25_004698 [Dendrobium thyrsiflorum]|uniref:Uncharacterized protein n=1 Tax=Dendrobium thyrsiflorum TaxID=117978 RepID=A0ABD0VGZ2_DENTH
MVRSTSSSLDASDFLFLAIAAGTDRRSTLSSQEPTTPQSPLSLSLAQPIGYAKGRRQPVTQKGEETAWGRHDEADDKEYALKIDNSILESVNKFLQVELTAFKENKTPHALEEFQKSSPQHASFKPRKRHHNPHRLVNPFSARDQINITPILLLTTYYIMTNIDFNAADIIICYFDNLTCIRDPRHKRKPNLTLGHLIIFVLESKYNLKFLAPPDHLPVFYSNRSFHILHSTHHHAIDQLVQIFDQWEARLDFYLTEQQQQYEQNLAHFDIYVGQQQQQ